MARILAAVNYSITIARLARHRRAAIRNGLVTLELIARHRLGRRGRLRSIEVQEGDSRLTLQAEDIGDMHALREVFADRTYELPPEIDRYLRGGSRVIADLGSHIGASVAWFRTRYPSARILGFEPNPRSFRKLASVVAEWPRVEVRPIAIAEAPGRRSLSIPGGEQINASLKVDLALAPSIEVDCVTLSQACAQAHVDAIDLLKLDIEGSELDVLRSFPALDRVRVVVGEFHPGLAGDRAALEAALAGFETRWQEQPKGDPLFVAVNARVASA